MGFRDHSEGGTGGIKDNSFSTLSEIVDNPPNTVTKSQILTSGQTFTFKPGGDLKPENAKLVIEGQENITSRTNVTLSDGQTVSIAGNAPPENASITITGVKNTTNRSVLVNNGNSISVGGNVTPENESVTITGGGSSSAQSQTVSDGESISVGGDISPSSDSVTLNPTYTSNDELITDITSYTEVQAACVDGSDIYIGDGTSVVKMDKNGTEKWTLTGSHGTRSVVSIDTYNGYVYSSSNGGSAVKSDQNGNEVWSNTYNFDVTGLEANGSGVIISNGGDDTVRKLDHSGTELWANTDHTGSVTDADMTSDGSWTFSTSQTDNMVIATNSVGTQQWQDSGYSNSPSAVATDDSQVYVGTYTTLRAYDLNGTFQWSAGVDASNIEIYDGRIYCLGGTGGISVYDTAGTQQWTSSSPYNSGFGVGGDKLVTGGYNGEVEINGIITRNASVSVDGNTVSSGELSASVTQSVNLSTGTHTVSKSSGEYTATIDWTERYRTVDPSVSLGGNTVSYTGTMAVGETHTEAIALSAGATETVSVAYTGTPPDSNQVDFTEIYQTKDPSVGIGSTSVSYTGSMNDGETYTENVSLGTGDLLVSKSYSGPNPTTTTDFDEVSRTKDPVSVTADAALYSKGYLGNGIKVEESLDLKAGIIYTVEYLSGEYDALIKVSWEETTA